jgi:hypothetical protein
MASEGCIGIGKAMDGGYLGKMLKIMAQENMEEWVVRRRWGDKAVRAVETHIIKRDGEEGISLLD